MSLEIPLTVVVDDNNEAPKSYFSDEMLGLLFVIEILFHKNATKMGNSSQVWKIQLPLAVRSGTRMPGWRFRCRSSVIALFSSPLGRTLINGVKSAR